MDNNTNSNFIQTQYKRLKVSQKLANNFTGHAVKICCKAIKSAQISIKQNKEGNTYYSGLMHCNSVWDCPHCSGVISAARRDEIEQALILWKAQGGKVKLITYTVQHDKGHSLKDLQSAVSQAYKYSKAGRGYQDIKAKFNIKGSIVANEVNYSDQYGWHYHRHEIIFYQSNRNFKELEQYIYEKYYTKLVQLGFSALPGIGVNVSKGEGSLSNYLSKWGLENELTSQKESYSKTPFQLLDDPVDHFLFVEYSKAMLGKRRITWSRGLKDYFEIDQLNDQDILDHQDKDQDQIIKVIDPITWKYIITNDLYLEVLSRAKLDLYRFDLWFHHNVSVYV